MNNNIELLLKEFKKISEKGWIESVSKSHGSVGLTFEKELNKKADSMYFPDFYDIEIKCTSIFSRYPLYLFTLSFDGPSYPEINRIIEKYGYYDKTYKDKKVLFENLNCKDKVIVNNSFKFKFNVDYDEEKLFLYVYNLNDELIEKKSFVYFDSIKQHLYLKLSTLALVYAYKKKTAGKEYFKYTAINIYKLKCFETFLKLLEKGIVEISLISRISKSGNREGKYCNKNLVFYIKKNFIPLLFDKIYTTT